MPLSEIFSLQGEGHFHRLESEALEPDVRVTASPAEHSAGPCALAAGFPKAVSREGLRRRTPSIPPSAT